jgi:hypothetical protein
VSLRLHQVLALSCALQQAEQWIKLLVAHNTLLCIVAWIALLEAWGYLQRQQAKQWIKLLAVHNIPQCIVAWIALLAVWVRLICRFQELVIKQFR